MTERRKQIDILLEAETDEGKKAVLVAERKCYPIVRIRKLTPRECFRLMDVSESDIDKLLTQVKKVKKGEEVLEQILANSSLYKCAGNSIVVSCLYDIFRTMLIEKNNGEKAKPFRSKPIQLTLFDM